MAFAAVTVALSFGVAASLSVGGVPALRERQHAILGGVPPHFPRSINLQVQSLFFKYLTVWASAAGGCKLKWASALSEE
jgi:hypothetical protein